MKFTRRDEIFFRDFESRITTVIGILLWGTGVVLAANKMLVGLPILGFLGTVGFIAVLKNYLPSYREAKEYRKKHMENGVQCLGTIVDAGVKKEVKESKYTVRDENSHEVILKNYWIKVEFTNPFSGKTVIGTSEYMSKSGKKHIGKKVKVYVLENAGAYCDTLSL